MNFPEFAATLKVGDYVIVRQRMGSDYIQKISKITPTRIILGDHQFYLKNGDERSNVRPWRRKYIVEELPTREQVQKARERDAANEAWKIERARINSVEKAATEALIPFLGPNVKVTHWSCEGEWKIEITKITEADVQEIIRKVVH